MALLERISTMKQSGMSETQITNTLMEEGNSPRDINEALSQSKIKAAVSSGDDPQSSGAAGDLQPSIMADNSSQQQFMSVPESGQKQPILQQPVPSAMPVQQYQQQYAPQAQEQYAQQYPDQASYDAAAYQQQYPDQGAYYQQAIDLETVRDISRQQVEEALKKIHEQVDSLLKTKSDMNFHLQDIENRMQRIENVIQEIQRAVLKKMGEYGDAISSISGEIKATQQSFSKVLNPLLDKQRGIKREESSNQEAEEEQKSEAEEETQKQQEKSKKVKKESQSQDRPRPNTTRPSQEAPAATFEDYFR